jgi:thiamine-monophosphate kinase
VGRLKADVTDVGEFELVERIRARVGPPGLATPVGIGDDAAVVTAAGAKRLLVTTDAAVERIHFRFSYSTPKEIGAKAAVGAISDIAAMGGAPTHLFLAIGIPYTTPLPRVDGIVDGILTVAGRWGAHLAGGDTTASPGRLFLVITVIGEAVGRAPITRDGARPGDRLLVTGWLGGSLAGLEFLRRAKKRVRDASVAHAVARYRAPVPRVAEAALLAKRFRPTSMIDISDGLSSEIHHLAEASGVGFRVDLDELPIDSGVHAVAKMLSRGGDLKRSVERMVLSSGDEYELLFTLPADEAEPAVRALRRAGTIARVIGEATAARAIVGYDRSGGERPIEAQGYRHF